MAVVHANWVALDEFALALRFYSEQTRDRCQATGALRNSVAPTWADAQSQAFDAAFEPTCREIVSGCDQLDELAAHLRRLAGLLRAVGVPAPKAGSNGSVQPQNLDAFAASMPIADRKVRGGPLIESDAQISADSAVAATGPASTPAPGPVPSQPATAHTRLRALPPVAGSPAGTSFRLLDPKAFRITDFDWLADSPEVAMAAPHHGNAPGHYQEVNARIPGLMDRLRRGETATDDPTYKTFFVSAPIKLDQQSDGRIGVTDGRHRLWAALKAGTAVPVLVRFGPLVAADQGCAKAREPSAKTT